mmetsp:Transcript_23036/g.50510  ORF Transcript_23036/g.50510 Transcript_23036/m.50510 type:complete len:274 (+) Transcript_23036:499-1320(+)
MHGPAELGGLDPRGLLRHLVVVEHPRVLLALHLLPARLRWLLVGGVPGGGLEPVRAPVLVREGIPGALLGVLPLADPRDLVEPVGGGLRRDLVRQVLRQLRGHPRVSHVGLEVQPERLRPGQAHLLPAEGGRADPGGLVRDLVHVDGLPLDAQLPPRARRRLHPSGLLRDGVEVEGHPPVLVVKQMPRAWGVLQPNGPVAVAHLEEGADGLARSEGRPAGGEARLVGDVHLRAIAQQQADYCVAALLNSHKQRHRARGRVHCCCRICAELKKQ